MVFETHRHPDVVREFAVHVPDDPVWVDVRGALLCGRSLVMSGGAPGSFAVVTPHVPLVWIVGEPAPALIVKAVEFVDGTAARPRCSPSAGQRQGGRGGPSRLAPRAGDPPHPSRRRGVAGRGRADRPLARTAGGVEDVLDHVPDALRGEMLDAVRHGAVACVWTDDRAVSFAYAPWTTERWFDISIDTLDGYRRRGFGGACARALIERHARDGRQPVWGAVASNVASRALAAYLGFLPAGSATVFEGSLGIDSNDDLAFEGHLMSSDWPGVHLC